MSRLNKKAQGISINVIIIAAIALAVLVILFAIFTGNIGKNVKEVNECKNKGGLCSSGAGCDSSAISGAEEGASYVLFKAQTEDCGNNACCIKVPGT